MDRLEDGADPGSAWSFWSSGRRWRTALSWPSSTATASMRKKPGTGLCRACG